MAKVLFMQNIVLVKINKVMTAEKRNSHLEQYLLERNIPTTSLEANSIREGIAWADENPKSEMVNKQEFIEKVRNWLKINTNWDMEYDEEGRNLDYGKIDELVKYLEE